MAYANKRTRRKLRPDKYYWWFKPKRQNGALDNHLMDGPSYMRGDDMVVQTDAVIGPSEDSNNTTQEEL